MNNIEYKDGDFFIDGMKQDMSGSMSFQEFETIYAAIRVLIRITGSLFDMTEGLDKIPKGLYVEIIRLHNAAVDYIEAYKELKNKEEN